MTEVFALAIQEVELVGGESWWSQNSGSLFVAIAAIIAAGLAAYVSIRNHKQQLAHDLKVRDRDATRQAIDSAVEGMSDLVLKGVTYSGHITTLERARAELESIDSSATEAIALQRKRVERAKATVQEFVPRVSAAINTIHGDTIRLAIRVGKEHALTTTQTGVRDALKDWILVLDKGWAGNRTEGELKVTVERKEEIRETRANFESACFAWMTSST